MARNTSIDIVLDRSDFTFRPNENVSGVVRVQSRDGLKHQGITLRALGEVKLQLSARTIGLFEAFYSSMKAIQIVNVEILLASSGRLGRGDTEYPFEFKMRPVEGQQLFDTYKGVYVTVLYKIHATIARGMLAKNIVKPMEILVEVPTLPAEKKQWTASVKAREGKRLPFQITPSSLLNKHSVVTGSKIPKFCFEGFLEGTVCDLPHSLQGEVVVRQTSHALSSVEIQLIRVETCSYTEGEAKEATEVQNIQLVDGNPIPNLPIPIYMAFPHTFVSSTVRAEKFKLDFEVNLIFIFADGHVVRARARKQSYHVVPT